MPTFYSYDLPNIESPAGTIKVKLYSEYSGLTVPTEPTITSIGDIEEKADVEPGIQEMGVLRVSMMDDYSTYTEGFWFKVLGAQTRLRFIIDEAGSDKFLFFGEADTLETVWTEHYVGASSYRRIADVTLLSFEAALFANCTYGTVMTEAMLHKVLNNPDTPAEGVPYSLIRIKNLFSCMLKVSGLNSTYNADDTTVIANFATRDLEYRYTGMGAGSYYGVGDMWVELEGYDSGLSPVTRYDDSVVVAGFATSDFRKFVGAVLNSFAITMQYGYDVANERFQIRLVQRGRAYADSAYTSFERFEQSTIRINTDLRLTGVKAYNILSISEIGWIHDGSTATTANDVPDYIDDIELDKPTLFKAYTDKTVPYSYTPPSNFMRLWGSGALDDGSEDINVGLTDWIDEVRWWNYATGAYVTVNSGSELVEQSVAGYLYRKYSTDFRVVTRRYDGIAADNGTTSSIENNRPLMRTSIDDGTGARDYSANAVKVFINEDACEVEWIEE